MAQIYTNSILIPSVCAFHDIESVQNIEQWVDSYEYSYSTTPSVSSPFYLNPPLQTFYDLQYGYAPYCKATFFAYGTEFFDTTACYHIYDPHKKIIPTKICRYIPTPESLSPPPSSQILSTIPGKYGAGSWYVTISRHPTELAEQVTSSLIVNALNINGTISTDVEYITPQTIIPEVVISVIYNSDSNELQLLSRVDTFNQQENAVYNIVANCFEIPVYTYLKSQYYYSSALTDSNSVYTIPNNIRTGGKLYSFIHNTTKGGLIETCFISGKDIGLIQSHRILSSSDVLTGISFNITTNGTLSSVIPTTPAETWYVSGFAIDLKKETTTSPRHLIDTTVSTGVTLIDTVTSYNAALKTPHNETATVNAGSVSLKYDLSIHNSTAGQYRETYIDLFNVNNINETLSYEKILTNSLPNANTVKLSGMKVDDNVFNIYTVVDSGTWNISGYATDIFYNSLFSTNTIDTLSNILSSSWANKLTYNTFTTGRLNVLILDTLNYTTNNKINYGASWNVTLATLGGQVLVNKTIHAVWSPPAFGQLYQVEQVNTVYNQTFYNENSASFNLFAYYQFTSPNTPIVLGLITDLPLEVYITKAVYSEPEIHLNNYSLALPITANPTSTGIITTKTANTNQYNRYGSSFYALATHKTDPTDITLFKHDQLATRNNLDYNTETLISSKLSPTITLTSLFTPIGTTNYSINFGASSKTSAEDYYIAGYEIPNITNFTPTLSNFSVTLKNMLPGVSSIQIDTIPTTFGYDAQWHLTIENLNRTSAKQLDVSVLFNSTPNTENQVLVDTLSSDITNSKALSSINSIITRSNETIFLTITGDLADIESLSGVFIGGYIQGTSNQQILNPSNPIYPTAPFAQVEHVFTYPGSYTIEVSALTGSINNPELVQSFLFPDYFKILDIPPVPRFEISNELPRLSNYQPVRPTTQCLCPSYYNYTNTQTNILTGSRVYVNTWATAPGSFPIAEIWIDFGDGTEIKKISRARDSFLEDGDSFAFYTIKQDPRNAVIAHDYEIQNTTSQTFTVTITAFSLNTGGREISQRTIYNIPPVIPRKKYILGNTILDNGKILYNIQTDANSTTTLSASATIGEIVYLNPRLYNILLG